MRFAVAPRNVERVEKIGFAPFNRCPKIKRGNKAGIVPRHAHRPILGSSAISRSIELSGYERFAAELSCV